MGNLGMPPLEKTLRNQLEIAVREARDVAEVACMLEQTKGKMNLIKMGKA